MLQRVGVFLLALFVGGGAVWAGELPWTTDIQGALKMAEAEGKPVFVDVWANWCVPCKQMDETTYRDAEVVEAAGAFVPLKVDHDLHEIFVERYRIEGLPAVLVLDGEGRVVTHREGLMTKPVLLALFEDVRGGYSDYLDRAGRTRKDPQAAREVADYLLAVGNPAEASRLLKGAVKALKRADDATRQAVELRLAQAQLADGQLKPARSAFEELADEAAEDGVRGEALAGLVRVHREQGRTEDADAALERLRREFPALVAGVEE